MTIAPSILLRQPPPDCQQLAVIAHGSGPMLVLAGPGSGKTAAICLRAANLLLTGRVEPQHLLLCTFTRAAALEMRKRLAVAARTAGYSGDLSRVRTTTIHGLCRWLLSTNGLNAGARQPGRILNAREQINLMEVHFHQLFGPDQGILEQYGWRHPRDTVRQARRFFDRIADEFIYAQALTQSGAPFLEALGRCHQRYQQLLGQLDAVDFGTLQSEALLLLRDDRLADHLGTDIHHLLVDEYQDTNFAQQQVLFRLGNVHRNICVVGDEDQLLYRFRGANPDGFIAFQQRFPDAATHRLTANYRSHRQIVALCNRWISSFDWSNPDPSGTPFRHPKVIVPRAPHANDNHPAVVSVLGHDQDDEGRRLADLLRLLKDQRFIADFDDAAILLPSVRERYSRRLVKAFGRAGIPVHLSGDEGHGDVADHVPADGVHPVGHVLLTTIHQAKGREWPVVCVGGLHAADLRADELEVELGSYLTRTIAEPADCTARFDLARQYYVAFSRARRLLVITAQREPHDIFHPLWDMVPTWTSLDPLLLSGPGNCATPDSQTRSLSDEPLRLVVPSSGTLILRPSHQGTPRLVFRSRRR